MINAAAAQTPSELAMVLATLPAHQALDIIAEDCRRQGSEWLRAAVEHGGVDVSSDSGWALQSSELRDVPLLVDAALAFLRSIYAEEIDEDQVFGQIEEPFHVLAFEADDDAFLATFTRLVDSFTAGERRMVQRLKEAATSNSTRHQELLLHFASQAQSIYAKLLIGAIVLGLSDVVRQIAGRCPACIYEGVPGHIFDGVSPSSGPRPTPFGIALRMGNIECLDILTGHSRTGTPPIGIMAKDGVQESVQIECAHAFRPFSCIPHVYAHALQRAIDACGSVNREGMLSRIHETALHAMEESAPKDLRSLIPVFLSVGAYEHDIFKSFRAAVVNGCPEVVRSFRGRVPWGRLKFDHTIEESPFVRCLIESQDNAREPHYEEALLAVIELAEEAGETGRVLQQFVDVEDGIASLEPLARVLDMQFNRVLVKFLEHGLDPARPIDGVVPLEIDAAQRSNGADIMRSWSARRRTASILARADESVGDCAANRMGE